MYVPKNESGHFRGLHIVVINPLDCSVVFAKVFDTYASSDGFDNFIRTSKIPEGFIIVAACKDDCTAKLSDKAKTWFTTNMGSKEISQLFYRCGFAFIGIFGKSEADQMNERRALSASKQVYTTQIFQVSANVEPEEWAKSKGFYFDSSKVLRNRVPVHLRR